MPTQRNFPQPASGTSLSETVVRRLEDALQGTLIRPGDADYDDARALFNALIDKRPALIARTATTTDVVASINFARENRLKVAIRGSGHNVAGLGVVEGGLVIDLSPIRAIVVDPATRTVRVGGGTRWGEVDQATHAYGLAVPGAIVTRAGVANVTLGGGLGHLSRQHGLTVDNLMEAEVVLADGRVVTASADEHTDLFWALRGGGGNFGVVTSFLFRAHPVHTIVGGPMLWKLEEAPALMRWYRDFIRTAPENASGFFAFLTVPPVPPFAERLQLQRMSSIVWAIDDSAGAKRILDTVREKFPPAQDLTGSLSFPVLQNMFSVDNMTGMQWYWRGDFVDELSDEAIQRHMAFARRLPTMYSTMHLYPTNGAVQRVGREETAFSYRESTWAQVIVGADPDPANTGLIRDWAMQYWEALHPYSAGGAYVNFLTEEGDARVRKSYRENYPRLARIKAKYDPTNFFQVNQNIKPAVDEVA